MTTIRLHNHDNGLQIKSMGAQKKWLLCPTQKFKCTLTKNLLLCVKKHLGHLNTIGRVQTLHIYLMHAYIIEALAIEIWRVLRLMDKGYCLENHWYIVENSKEFEGKISKFKFDAKMVGLTKLLKMFRIHLYGGVINKHYYFIGELFCMQQWIHLAPLKTAHTCLMEKEKSIFWRLRRFICIFQNVTHFLP